MYPDPVNRSARWDETGGFVVPVHYLAQIGQIDVHCGYSKALVRALKR
jgi:hypothetical protein